MRPASHGAWRSADPHTDQQSGAGLKGVRESLCIWGFDRSEMSGILSEKCCLSWDLKEEALAGGGGESEGPSRSGCVWAAVNGTERSRAWLGEDFGDPCADRHQSPTGLGMLRDLVWSQVQQEAKSGDCEITFAL